MNFSRQVSTLPVERIIWPVAIIGAGGIGSPTVLEFAKLGFADITLIDPDTIEEANIPTQLLWGPGDQAKRKVDAAKERVLQLAGLEIKTYARSFPFENERSGGLLGLLPPDREAKCKSVFWGRVKWDCRAPLFIVISGFDSMKSRRIAWEYMKWNLNVPLYIEGRTGVGSAGQWLEVHTVRPCIPQDVAFYEQWLYGDAEADESLACNGFLPVNTAIASLIASQASKWIMGEPYYQRVSLDLATLTIVRQGQRGQTAETEQKSEEKIEKGEIE